MLIGCDFVTKQNQILVSIAFGDITQHLIIRTIFL